MVPPPQPVPPAPALPDAVGGWVVQGVLGRGATATVLQVQRADGAQGALKLLHRVDPGAVARMRREAEVLQRVQHPHVVSLLEVLEHGGQLALVLELVEGSTLAQRLRRGPVPLDEAEALFLGLLDGIGAAHAAGLVHRDIKPANVLLTSSGQPRIADFGLAQQPDAMVRLTQTGALLGTPAYMAPEQLRAPAEVDARADVFALGCVLYELLCGRGPFCGADVLQIAHRAATGRYPDPAALVPGLQQRFVDAIVGALQPEPAARIADVSTLRDVLLGVVDWQQRWVAPSPDETYVPETLVPGRSRPEEARPLVGRAQERRRLSERLAAHALVTVVGPGGVGKTALARALAAGWDEVAFVELTPARTLDALVAAVAGALELRTPDGDVAQQIEAIGRALAHRPRALVVLDNFEQLLPYAGQTVGLWSRVAPQLRWLVTSREQLALSGEVVVSLHPLPPDDAVALLQQRVSALGPLPGAAEEDWHALADALDRLPLALELAAPAAAQLGPGALLRQWASRDSWLRDEASAPRHSTLHQLLEWSWGLLSPPERAAYAQLSVFPGGFRPAAAEVVVALPDAQPLAPVLASLRRRHLLVARPDPATPGRSRLHMYAHVHEHAASKLSGAALSGARERLVSWAASLGTWEGLDAASWRGGEAVRRGWTTERANLEAAWSLSGDGDPRTIPIALVLSEIYDAVGPYSAVLPVATRALTLQPEPWQRTWLARAHASALVGLGQLGAATAQIEEALAHPQLAGEAHERGLLLRTLGMLACTEGRFSAALEHTEAALELIGHAHRIERARLQRNIASIAFALGQHARGRQALEQAMEVLATEGTAVDLGWAKMLESEALSNEGRLWEGLARTREGHRTFARVGFHRGAALTMYYAGTESLLLGQLSEAEDELRQALDGLRRTGEVRLIGQALSSLGYVRALDGDLQEGHALASEGLQLVRGLSSAKEGQALDVLAEIAWLDGRRWEAIALLEEARACFEQEGERDALSVRLARMLAEQGEVARALELAAAAIERQREREPYRAASCLAGWGYVAQAAGRTDEAAAALAQAEALAGRMRLGPRSPASVQIAELRDLVHG